MSYITDEVLKLYPSLGGVRIVINSVSGPAQALAISLFDQGANLIASDKNKDNITALSRILYERSGSMYRYRQVPFNQAQLEPAEVFIQLAEPIEGPVNAKYTIKPKPKATKPVSAPVPAAADLPATSPTGVEQGTQQPEQPAV